MAKAQEIELFISDDGEIKVHIKGIKGPGCLKILDSLSQEIGPKKEVKLSPEYYESAEDEIKTDSKIKNKYSV